VGCDLYRSVTGVCVCVRVNRSTSTDGLTSADHNELVVSHTDITSMSTAAHYNVTSSKPVCNACLVSRRLELNGSNCWSKLGCWQSCASFPILCCRRVVENKQNGCLFDPLFLILPLYPFDAHLGTLDAQP